MTYDERPSADRIGQGVVARDWMATDVTAVHDGVTYRLWIEHGTRDYAERWVNDGRG